MNRCKWKRLGDRRALCLVGLEQIKSLRACDGASPIARVCRSSASIINEKSDVQAPSDTTCGGFHSFLTIRSLYIDIDFIGLILILIVLSNSLREKLVDLITAPAGSCKNMGHLHHPGTS